MNSLLVAVSDIARIPVHENVNTAIYNKLMATSDFSTIGHVRNGTLVKVFISVHSSVLRNASHTLLLVTDKL